MIKKIENIFFGKFYVFRSDDFDVFAKGNIIQEDHYQILQGNRIISWKEKKKQH